MNKFLSALEILDSDDIKFEDVYIPEWNGTVRVKALNGKERDEYEAHMWQVKNNTMNLVLKDTRAFLVYLSVVDEKMKRLFTKSQVEKLSEKSSSALDKIVTVASKLSGLSQEDKQRLQENLKNE